MVKAIETHIRELEDALANARWNDDEVEKIEAELKVARLAKEMGERFVVPF